MSKRQISDPNQPQNIHSSFSVESPESGSVPTDTDQSRSFSTTDDDPLKRFNIVRKGVLRLNSEAALCKAVAASQTLGSEELWSNDTFYNHLTFLINSVINKNAISSQMVVDSFSFRSTAMIPSHQKMIVVQENQISPVYTSLLGMMNKPEAVADPTIAEDDITIPQTPEECSGMITFFITEVRKPPADSIHFNEHIPRVLPLLVACARHLGKSHIRGAITTGFKWYFIVVDLDTEGDGAKYWVSQLIEWKTKRGSTSEERHGVPKKSSDEYDPALIAGILSSWIPKGFMEFSGDEWFYMPKGSV